MISLKGFTGEFPRTEPHLLPDGAAQVATDCDFSGGILTGIRSRTSVPSMSVTSAKSLYVHDATNNWYQWPVDVDAARGPVANDKFNRFYWTDGTGMYVAQGDTGSGSEPSGSNKWRVGVPQPRIPLSTSLDTSKFRVAIGGVEAVGGGFSAVCEMPDGSISQTHWLGANEATVDIPLQKMWRLPLDGFSCDVVESKVTSSSLLTGYFDYFDKTTSTTVKMYIDPTTKARYVVTYLVPNDPTSTEIRTSIADTVYPDAGRVDGESSSDITPTMAIQFVVDLDNGARCYATIRQNYIDSILPPEMEGVSAYFVIDGTEAVVTLSRSGSALDHRAYTYTYVNIFGEEGAPAYPMEADVLDGDSLDLHYVAPTVAEDKFTVSYWAVGGGFQATCVDAEGTVVSSHWLGANTATVDTPAQKTWVLPMSGFTCAGTTLVIVMILDMNDGTRRYAKIHSSAAASEIPPAMAGISASYSLGGGNVTITMTRDSGSLITGYAPINSIRVYRTSTGSSTTEYLLVGEAIINTADPIFNDSVLGASLAEPLATLEYYPPPVDVSGLTALPNGIFAMFLGNEVMFTEPYLPYAVKTDSVMTTASDIVGMCAAEGGLYVTTKSNPYFISGMTPDAMSQTKITSIQAGVSKGSICNIGQAVLYASNDGLAMARGVDVSMDFSFKFFTREVWRKLYASKLDKMRLSAHDGNLLVWFSDGTPGFLMRVDGENPSITRCVDPITAAFVFPQGDALYVVYGSSVYEFKGGATTKAFSWKSKEFTLPRPINYGFAQMVGSGTISLEVIADGVSKHTRSITLPAYGSVEFRLPSGFLARSWELVVTGSAGAELEELSIAQIAEELKNG